MDEKMDYDSDTLDPNDSRLKEAGPDYTGTLDDDMDDEMDMDEPITGESGSYDEVMEEPESRQEEYQL